MVWLAALSVVALSFACFVAALSPSSSAFSIDRAPKFVIASHENFLEWDKEDVDRIKALPSTRMVDAHGIAVRKLLPPGLCAWLYSQSAQHQCFHEGDSEEEQSISSADGASRVTEGASLENSLKQLKSWSRRLSVSKLQVRQHSAQSRRQTESKPLKILQTREGFSVSGAFADRLQVRSAGAAEVDMQWQGHRALPIPGHLATAYVQEYKSAISDSKFFVGFICVAPQHSGGQAQSVLRAATRAAPDAHWQTVTSTAWCNKLWPLHVQHLQSVSGSCVQRNEGWWTYEVCVGRSVRQFHAAAGSAKPAADFSLGRFEAGYGTVADTPVGRGFAKEREVGGGSSQVSLAPVSVGLPEAPALVQMFTDGTPCDETGKARETEVRFVCQGDEALQLRSVKEVATCRYVVSIAAAAACAHSELSDLETHQNGPPVNQVHCFPATKFLA